MASLALNLSRLNPTQNIALADRVLPNMDPVQPPPPAPAIPPAIPGLTAETAVYKAARDKANTSNNAYLQAKVALDALKEVRDADHDALKVEQASYSKAIEAKAKGDPVLLAATGFPLAADPVHSTEPTGPVFNFFLTQGDSAGVIDGSHDRPERTTNFEVEVTTVDSVAGPYVLMISPTTSTWHLTGLTSGQRIWARVRANGPNGHGPWSDPFSKIVP